MHAYPSTPVRARRLTGAGVLRSLFLAGSAFAWLGCASVPMPFASATPADSSPVAPSAESVDSFAPSGPGTVFPSIEAAAADALVFSYLESRTSRDSQGVVRGGTIFPSEGGYSYGEPARSDEGATDRVRYRLQPRDVAHYRQFPANVGSGVISKTGKLVVGDRRVVDRRDPLGRPLFYLTPKRQMKVYLGAEEGNRSLGRIAFGVAPGDTEVELTHLALASDSMPLAAQGGIDGGNASR